MLQRQVEPPIKPDVTNDEDTNNFEKYPDSAENSTQAIDARDQELFDDF